MGGYCGVFLFSLSSLSSSFSSSSSPSLSSSLSLSPLLSLFSSSFFFLLSSLLFHSSLPLSLSLLPLLSTLLSPLSYFLILQAQFYLSGYYLEDMAVTIPNTYNSYLALFAALPAALAEAQGVKFRIFFLLF